MLLSRFVVRIFILALFSSRILCSVLIFKATPYAYCNVYEINLLVYIVIVYFSVILVSNEKLNAIFSRVT